MRGKIGIVACVKPGLMPYLDKYRAVLDEQSMAYDVICWDRNGSISESEKKGNVIIFRAHGFAAPSDCTDVSRWRKLVPFAQYSRFVRTQIRRHQYDKLIVLTSVPGTLLYDVLLGPYRGRYIFDYRDCSYERFWPYAWLMHRIADQSAFTAVSSPGFSRYLPSEKLVLCHNNGAVPDTEDLPDFEPLPFTRAKTTISYIGHVRYAAMNEAIVRQLANQDDFELRYIGNGAAEQFLHELAHELKANNIVFHSRFDPQHKPDFYLDADLTNNVYGNRTIEVQYALSNRLYESAYYGRPILTSSQTMMCKTVTEYGLGFGVELPGDDLREAVAAYRKMFDYRRFRNGCRQFLAKVRRDDEIFRQKLADFCAA